jgi:hypothetical protein
VNGSRSGASRSFSVLVVLPISLRGQASTLHQSSARSKGFHQALKTKGGTYRDLTYRGQVRLLAW